MIRYFVFNFFSFCFLVKAFLTKSLVSLVWLDFLRTSYLLPYSAYLNVIGVVCNLAISNLSNSGFMLDKAVFLADFYV